MITTIRIKDLTKYLVIITVLIVTVMFITRFFLNKKKETLTEKNYSLIKNNDTFLSCIDVSIPIAKTLNTNKNDNNEDLLKKERNKESTSRSGFLRILDVELPNIIENNNNEAKEKLNTEENNAKENEEIERIEINDTYTNQYNSVKVKNLTSIKLTESILKPDYKVKNCKDIIIYHTHTCESYTQTEANTYKPTGNYRTTDLRYSVVRVGDELEEELKKHKFNVTHNNIKHDYPAYTGSYSRSLETVEKIQENQKDTEIIFDLHRDAIGSKGSYAPTVEINGEKVAQIMFVIGTNDGGGNHPNWKNNMKFAVKVQEKGNEMYPGLFRAINLRSATFNQKVSNAASIIEVGATGNTLEEATASMKYFANVLDEILK